jgi:ATP-dependent RNA helicase RhlE
VTFEELNLNTPLRNAIEDLGYVYPTPIQSEAFSVIMSGKDVIGVAQTGTGKTFAYLLPILRQLKYSEQKKPRVLIMVPTRELVLQVIREIKKLTEYITVRYAGVYGGTNINTQKQIIHNGLDILVATPGRLMDLYMTGILRFKDIQKLVIDEVDEMLKLGFRPQVEAVMELLPTKRQNLMFSATLTEEVEQLILDFFYEPQKIEIARHGTPLEKITQVAYHVPNFFTKVNLLKYLLQNDNSLERVLVFVATKKLADRLEEQLIKDFSEAIGVIHSNKSQNQRFNVLDKFRDGENRVIIATDIIARGLDIADVSHVVNFDMPSESGDYIHRIGRTGRADKDGVAISFINEAEQEQQMKVEALMKKAIPLEPLPEDLKISTVFTDEERPNLGDKEYYKAPSIKHSKGAFQEKKVKNRKANSGSPARKKSQYKKSGKKIKRKR